MKHSQINHPKGWGFSRRSLNLNCLANTKKFNVASAKRETRLNKLSLKAVITWLKQNSHISIQKSIRLMVRLLRFKEAFMSSIILIIISFGYPNTESLYLKER